MKQKDSTTWQLDSIDELRPRCKASDKGKKKYRFHCPLCGDEQKHLKRTDGAFDEEKGVGHCFCCGANDTQKISHVLRQIVDFAHQYKVLVILVAHPKKPQTDGVRKGEPQMPSLYDIAGSADFYNKCDYGLILQRQRSDEYTKGQTLTWIHVLKIRFRHLGQIGRRAFGYDSTCGRFVGTRDDNISLREYDRSDWSARAPEQQQLAFEEPDLNNDLPF